MGALGVVCCMVGDVSSLELLSLLVILSGGALRGMEGLSVISKVALVDGGVPGTALNVIPKSLSSSNARDALGDDVIEVGSDPTPDDDTLYGELVRPEPKRDVDCVVYIAFLLS